MAIFGYVATTMSFGAAAEDLRAGLGVLRYRVRRRAGITADDSVLVISTGQSPGAATFKMSDPLATIAKRSVYPFQSPIREQRRSG
jgi:hypothetical protein